jgi:hypothetical protein
MKIYKNTLIVLSSIFFLIACSEEKTENKLKTLLQNESKPREALTLKIVRIEQEMFQKKSKNNIKNVLAKYPTFSEKFLRKSSFPHDSMLVNSFYRLINNKSIDTIYHTCQDFYGDFSDVGYQFQDAFKVIKSNYPTFKFPSIYTVITGMGNDMYVSDSLIVVGLEFFLAEKSRYAPNFPVYIQKRYRKEFIAPMALLVISNKYNETDYLDNSLVAEMIYYGKSYYFLENLLPELPDSLIAGYSQEVLDDVLKNQSIIWAHFVDKKLLFETKHEVVNRYIGERPSTAEIGNKCPGRIGRWVGWQIVRNYMERHPELKLSDLMREKDARKIFIEAKYKPKM